MLTSTLAFRGNSASSQDLFCQQFGAESVITTSKLFVTTRPASTFAVNPEIQRGCVIRRKHWSELRRELLITPDQERNCNKASNTFAYTRDNNGEIINKKIAGLKPSKNSIEAFTKSNVIIDFTVPKCTLEILKIASKLKKRVVIGTTGFSKKEENLIKQYSRKIPILKAGNMSLGVNLLMYLTEIASKSLGNNFLSKVYEVHHKHKIDYPSGTALMLGRGIADGKNKNFYNLIGKKYLNKKSFPYAKKINFNSIRKGEVIGEHEVRFSSGKEIIKLNHESFDRALYSEGALTAATWLMSKKAGLYSMRDLLNFK